MSKVVSLAAYKEENAPHWAGRCKCIGCGHEWVGVGPIGVVIALECPECGLPKGVTKCLFGGEEGDAVFVCQVCGSEAMTAYKRNGHFHQRCMGCGTDQTEAIYG